MLQTGLTGEKKTSSKLRFYASISLFPIIIRKTKWLKTANLFCIDHVEVKKKAQNITERREVEKSIRKRKQWLSFLYVNGIDLIGEWRNSL